MKGKMAAKKLPSKFYAGADSNVAHEAESTKEGFKRGGKTVKMMGEKSKAHAGRKARKSGGGVLSSASGPGTPRGKASHY
jgi:hypothetical protein